MSGAMFARDRRRPCVCWVYPVPAIGEEMIVYSPLCRYGVHFWYARQDGDMWRHSYQPIGTRSLTRSVRR